MPPPRPRRVPLKTALRPSARCCPVCGNHLVLRILSGTEIDVCPDHGVWLDPGELQFLIRRQTKIRHSSEKERLRKARRDGKAEGCQWGLLAFLWD